MKGHFIITQDKETFEALKNRGYTFVRKDVDGTYIFLNDASAIFDASLRKNFVYTDMLSV